MDDEKYILTTEELVAWKNEIQDVKKLEQEEREIAIKLNGSLPKIENKYIIQIKVKHELTPCKKLQIAIRIFV